MKIEINELTKSFGGQNALDGITLNVDNMSSLAIIGPSGGGKTTLLRILAGLEIPDSGTIALNGRGMQFQESDLIAHRKRVGVVFQAYNLFPHLSALQNIILPLTKTRGIAPIEAKSIAEDLLLQFGLADHQNKQPNQLSGGQKQRVAIARALSLRPEVLMFDEPTSALDPEITSDILDVILKLREEGRNIIIVTHEIGFARRACDYVAFVSKGRVEAQGSSDTLYQHSESEEFNHFVSRIIEWKV
jgi:polar amino acid transport system ATP-binding protein